MNAKRSLVVNTPGSYAQHRGELRSSTSYSIVPTAPMAETIADMHESVKSMQSAIDVRNANKPTVKMGKAVVTERPISKNSEVLVEACRPTVKMVRLIHPGKV
jgi:hypothetical protein